MAMAAQFERDMISERVAAAAPGKAERGSYNGGPIPFGYELGDDGGLVPSEDAKWIRYMFRRYAHEGASFYAICAELEAEGVPARAAANGATTRCQRASEMTFTSAA